MAQSNVQGTQAVGHMGQQTSTATGYQPSYQPNQPVLSPVEMTNDICISSVACAACISNPNSNSAVLCTQSTRYSCCPASEPAMGRHALAVYLSITIQPCGAPADSVSASTSHPCTAGVQPKLSHHPKPVNQLQPSPSTRLAYLLVPPTPAPTPYQPVPAMQVQYAIQP